MKRTPQFLAAAVLAFWTAVAVASPWDDQIAQWKKESDALQAEQIASLEAQAKNGDTRAIYLLFREAVKPRYQFDKSPSANLIGQWTLKLADAGNPIGMDMLCELMMNGENGLERNQTNALQWCLRGAQMGYGDAMFMLAGMYAAGIGTNKDEVKAVDWYRKGAEAGSPKAMQALASKYVDGKGGLPKDEVKAFEWFNKSAELGDPYGMYGVGWAYELGKGVVKNETQAVTWYQKSAAVGNAASMYSLGSSYAVGKGGLSRNEPKAFELYKKSAELGDSNGMNGVGWAYELGKGIAKDETQAVLWYRKASEAGNGPATVALGYYYGEGKGGLTKDDKQAFSLYQKAFEIGHADAALAIGWTYENGRGAPKDAAQALAWYRKGADLKSASAMVALGTLYRGGIGVNKDGSQAVMWFRQAAALGYADAMNSLGAAYSDGNGVPKDEAVAADWFQKAAALDHGLAMASLGKMHSRGQGGFAKDYRLARQWYEKAVAVGEPYGLTAIGEMYSNGDGIERNRREANAWYFKAAEKGEGTAMVHLALSLRNGDGIARDINLAASWLAKALASVTNTKFYESGESVQIRSRRLLDEMLSKGEITDAQALREVKAISKPAPKVEWVVAPQSAGEEEVTFKVRVNDNGGGVGDVQFKLNGVAMGVGAGRNLVVESTDVRTFTVRLPAGQHEVEVMAYNAENLINWTSLKTTVTSTFKQVRKPQLHAVVVGINQYGDSTLELNYAVNDAAAVAKELQTNAAKLYDQVHIQLLSTRSQTGKAAILQAIKEAANRAQPEDVFIFYVAGHGQTTDRDGYQMMTADVRNLAAQSVRENSITADELQRAVYNVPSARKVILLDTCQSGEGIDVSKLLSRPEVHAQDNRDMMNRIKRKSGAMVLAAAQSKEQALEGYKGHGIFTYALLEGLEGKADSNKDGLVSTFELQEYVMKRADQLAEQVYGRAQQPYPAALSGFDVVRWR